MTRVTTWNGHTNRTSRIRESLVSVETKQSLTMSTKKNKPKTEMKTRKVAKATENPEREQDTLADFAEEVLGHVSKGDTFELVEKKGANHGLSQRGGVYRAMFYRNGVMIARSTKQNDISKAREVRDSVFDLLEKKHGAKWRGSRSSDLIASAKADPEGMDGIYESTIYRVSLAGITYTTTTNLDLAKKRRNEAIKHLSL